MSHLLTLISFGTIGQTLSVHTQFTLLLLNTTLTSSRLLGIAGFLRKQANSWRSLAIYGKDLPSQHQRLCHAHWIKTGLGFFCWLLSKLFRFLRDISHVWSTSDTHLIGVLRVSLFQEGKEKEKKSAQRDEVIFFMFKNEKNTHHFFSNFPTSMYTYIFKAVFCYINHAL